MNLATRTFTGTLDELRSVLPASEIKALERLLAEAQVMEAARPRTTYDAGIAAELVPKRLRMRVHCHAHRTNGEPCRAWAIRGGTVCKSHGGAAPQVRMAAQRRLEMAAVRRRVELNLRREAYRQQVQERALEIVAGQRARERAA